MHLVRGRHTELYVLTWHPLQDVSPPLHVPDLRQDKLSMNLASGTVTFQNQEAYTKIGQT